MIDLIPSTLDVFSRQSETISNHEDTKLTKIKSSSP